MRRNKRVPVLPLVQHGGSPGGEEGCIGDAKKTKYGSQIRFHEIERGHLCLGVVDPAGCDDEGRLLADNQALRPSLPVGKVCAYLADPPPTNPMALHVSGAIIASHFAAFFFAGQVVGGLLLLIGLFVPLALRLLAAELYNILAFHLTMAPAGIAPALVA